MKKTRVTSALLAILVLATFADGSAEAQTASPPAQASPAATAAPSPAPAATPVPTPTLGPPTEATTRQAASGALFRRMQSVNAKLKAYKADLHVDVALKTFPFISTAFDGHVYHKQPDKDAVIFDVVPALASQFKKLYARIEPPSLWSGIFVFEILDNSGGTATFRLVPRKHGRVAQIDVSVDDATATIRGYRWVYDEGGSIAFAQTFTKIEGNYLVDGQTGQVDLPGYKADVKSSLRHYSLNPVLPDELFGQPG